jgi:hypothetical protein
VGRRMLSEHWKSVEVTSSGSEDDFSENFGICFRGTILSVFCNTNPLLSFQANREGHGSMVGTMYANEVLVVPCSLYTNNTSTTDTTLQ